MQRTTTMMTRGMLVGLGVLALYIGTASPALADDRRNHNRDECNLRSLKGTYVFTQDGFENRRIVVPTDPEVSPTALLPADRRPFAYAGRETYDGKGNVAGINTIAQARGATTSATSTTQPVAVNAFVEYSGTYTVDASCTAVVRVADNPDPNDPPEPGDPVFFSIYHLFLSPDGEKFTFIVYSAAVVQNDVFIEEAQELTGVGVAYRVD
jgi:hypothetical protein